MSERGIELGPVDFITVETIGPKGKRVFHLQAGQGDVIVSLVIEKQQAQALAQAIDELLGELADRAGPTDPVNLAKFDMALREPIEPIFRVAQMGLGYDEARDMVVLVVQELTLDQDEDSDQAEPPRVARFWASREQMRRLSQHAAEVVKQGRADPRQNGRVVYYWL